MKKTLFLITATLLMHGAFAAKPKNKYVEIQTEHGICTVKLYNETPMHTDNFLKLVKLGFYNGLLFHRVIENFMIQGGDPNSRYAAEKQILGQGDVDYRIPAEIQNDLFHRKGVLAAARDDNPEKASSGAQFYLVQGRIFTDEELDRLEEHRLEGRKIPDSHREVYKTIGGVPHLDQNYTVFGEIVKGLKMVDAIAALPTDQMDRPLEDQKMKMRILKRREVRKLEKELINNNQL